MTSKENPDLIGGIIADGKTKTIRRSVNDEYTGYGRNKDIVTWADQYSLAMPGKGEWATTVTCNLFEVFKRAGLPVAYLGRVDETTFQTELCEMFPYEVVVVGIVDPKSSYLKRNPEATPEEYMEKPTVDFFLKTSGRKFTGGDGITRELPCDDPIMVFGANKVEVYRPNAPLYSQRPIFTIPMKDVAEVFPGFEQIDTMLILARRAYLVAREAYERVGGKLYDGKWEFGRARRPSLKGTTLLADVFDADSMRLTVNGERADKQVIRNGGAEAAPEQAEAYRLAAATSELLVQ